MRTLTPNKGTFQCVFDCHVISWNILPEVSLLVVAHCQLIMNLWAFKNNFLFQNPFGVQAYIALRQIMIIVVLTLSVNFAYFWTSSKFVLFWVHIISSKYAVFCSTLCLWDSSSAVLVASKYLLTQSYEYLSFVLTYWCGITETNVKHILSNSHCAPRLCAENWGAIDDKVREGVPLGLSVERGSLINQRPLHCDKCCRTYVQEW